MRKVLASMRPVPARRRSSAVAFRPQSNDRVHCCRCWAVTCCTWALREVAPQRSLVSNHIAGLHNLVAAEALAAGRAAGLSLETMLAVLRHTDAQSYWLFNYLAPRILGGDFDDGFSIDLQHKDHRLFGEMAARHGAAAPLNDLALQLYDSVRAAGLGRKDLTEAANVACDQAGLTRFDDDRSASAPERAL